MTADVAVVLGAVLSIAGLSYFFFGPKQTRRAAMHGGVQEIVVTVKGATRPTSSGSARAFPCG